ncbi:calcium-translocating P-type ATPase, SERCA-type [Methanocella arvoryzae]|nr:calcium-translocating P-type ATPase, SERCA-type [Methanocella arvoryzae]
MDADRVVEAIGSSPAGLSEKEAAARLIQYGPNELKQKKKTSLFVIFLRQFKNVLIYVLIVAMAISFLLGEVLDAEIIGAIIVLNALLGTYQEVQAERSIDALKKFLVHEAFVVRDGEKKKVHASSLVPGDVIEVDAGDYIPADARLITISGLTVDESALTGESEPALKHVAPVPEDTPVGDRDCMIYAGTIVTAGRCRAVVVSTGMNTEIGRIASLVETGVDRQTPVQISIDRLGKLFGIAALIVCVVIFIAGILEGQKMFDMFLVAVSLAVAAIPEGLPATVTIIFALGVRRMASRKAIVRTLASVETLGSTSVICTDKTGTLTQNAITVRRIATASGIVEVTGEGYTDKGQFMAAGTELEPARSGELWTLLTVGILCNNATYERTGEDYRMLGDSTEVALLIAGAKAGLVKKALEEDCPRELEVPFSSDTMFMLTANRCKSGYVAYIKGAPERILDRCTHLLTNGGVVPLTPEARKRFIDENQYMASHGMRVLGLGYKQLADLQSETLADAETGLTFVGLTGMIDPPRPEVRRSIELCQHSGIKVVMITGDQLLTAVSIARELGIYSEGDEAITGTELAAMSDQELSERIMKITVYARTSPEQKQRIVKALQQHDLVVSMTGDGVNDAPALKNADIGVSMGITGTEVARQASDVVLADDNFTTIVNAVEEGRTIFNNVRKTVIFLFSSNLGEVLTILLGILLALPLPLLAIQILWVNLISDSLPAMALGMDKPDRRVMDRPPRPRSEGILTKGLAIDIALIGIVLGITTLAIFYLYLGSGVDYARTMAFATLIVLEMWVVLICKIGSDSLFSRKTLDNPYLLGAIVIALALLLIVLYVPFLQVVFSTVTLNLRDVGIIFGVVMGIAVVVEVIKALMRRIKV